MSTAMSSQSKALLEQLRPRARHAGMDLVAQAGIEVSAWAFKRDPKNPVRFKSPLTPGALPDAKRGCED